MQMTIDAKTLNALAASAADYWFQSAQDVRKRAYDFFSEKETRYGFLWLKKRKLTEEEIQRNIKACNRWDHPKHHFAYEWSEYINNKRVAENLYEMSSNDCTGFILDEREVRVIMKEV